LNRALNINNIFYIAMAKEYSTLKELYEDEFQDFGER